MADTCMEIVAQELRQNEGDQAESGNESGKDCCDKQENIAMEQSKEVEDNVESTNTESHAAENATVDNEKETSEQNDSSVNGTKSDEKEESAQDPSAIQTKSPNDKHGAAKAKGTPPMERAEKKKDDITDEQRKAKIDEIRKKKITDYKKKEDEKRKAVLERKKKLEQAEREKHEALLKKISATFAPTKRPASAPARRAVSFSSLAHLKKTHAVAQDIDIGEGRPAKAKEAEDKSVKVATSSDRRRTLPPRPMSAMERKRPNSISADKGKPATKDETRAVGTDKTGGRPKSSIGARAEPKIRQSISNLPYRPSSAAAAHRQAPKSDEPKPKTGMGKSRPSMPPLPGKPLVPPNRQKEMKKSSSSSTVVQHSTQEKSKGPMQPGVKTPDRNEKALPKTSPGKPDAAKPKAEVTKTHRLSAGKAKESTRPASTEGPERRPPKERSPAAKSDTGKKAGIMDEAEAKRIMAEKRRQVKEEQERKKLEEENRLEEERIRKEEEQKRRAEELLREQERQKAHLEELRKEAEERERKEKEEKLRKEMEEKEKLEAEKRQRQEDIDRRAQEEVEKRAKEREHKRQQEEAERLERKKRVQEILGSRVRSSPVADRPASPVPFMTANSEEGGAEHSPPAIDTAASARDRVQRLLDKSQRKSDDSPNGSENGEARTLVKPLLSPERSIGESKTEDSSHRADDKHADVSKTSEQSAEGSLESSLTEADKQTMEDEKRRNDENADHSIKNGAGDVKENKLEENQNIEAISEEKMLWKEAEKSMDELQSDLLNSFEPQTNTKTEQTQSSQENALWQLVEGKLELEECF